MAEGVQLTTDQWTELNRRMEEIHGDVRLTRQSAESTHAALVEHKDRQDKVNTDIELRMRGVEQMSRWNRIATGGLGLALGGFGTWLSQHLKLGS